MASIEDNVLRIYQESGKIHAIKYYREYTSSSLETSKAYVDKLTGNNVIPAFTKELRDFNIEVKCEVPAHVKKTQQYVESGVNQSSRNSVQVPNIFSHLDQYDQETIEFSLGDFGKDLVAFGKKICKDHPSLSEIQSGTLVAGGKVYERVYDSLKIGEFAKRAELKTMPQVIVDWLNRNHKRITKAIQKPPARLLNEEDRNAQRKVSRLKEINLQTLLASGKSAWDSVEENFVPYTRLGPGFKEIIEYTNKMKERCAELGLKSACSSVGKDAKEYENRLNDKYCDFIHIKLDEAAAVLAKTMGGQYSINNGRVTLSARSFSRPFWSCDNKQKLEQDPYVSDVYHQPINLEAVHRQNVSSDRIFNYLPRAYPLHDFAAKQTDYVKDLVAKLDAYPECNNLPLFDQLWVVVPGVHQSSSLENDQWKFNDGKTVHAFHDYWEYIRNLDAFLTESREIFPVILGENVSTKKCYFVSYWM